MGKKLWKNDPRARALLYSTFPLHFYYYFIIIFLLFSLVSGESRVCVFTAALISASWSGDCALTVADNALLLLLTCCLFKVKVDIFGERRIIRKSENTKNGSPPKNRLLLCVPRVCEC